MEDKIERISNANKNLINIIEKFNKTYDEKFNKMESEIRILKNNNKYLTNQNDELECDKWYLVNDDDYKELLKCVPNVGYLIIDNKFFNSIENLRQKLKDLPNLPMLKKLIIHGCAYDSMDEYYKILNCIHYKCSTYNDLKKILINKNLTSLSFNDNFNENIDIIKNEFPKLTSLCFGNSFNKDISELEGGLPMLNKLIIYGNVYKNINEYIIMGKCEEYVCKDSDDLVNISKYYNLKSLSFGGDKLWDVKFNTSIDTFKCNLPNLTSLTFGWQFNQSIDVLKNRFHNLNKLSFGYEFNQPIDALKDNFSNLTSLTFGWRFNQPIDVLKNSFPLLTNLCFDGNFNQPIDILKDSFPNLTYLSLGECFDKPVDALKNSFPNLTKLYIRGKLYKNINDYLNTK